MDENNKVFFIVNKYSGTSFRPSVEGKIITRCNQLNLECTLEYTQGRGHATELARSAVSQGFKKVFVVGGDGTVNEAARGLVHSRVAMGILPKGSGNGLARHLKVPMNFSRALELIASTREIDMDTFSINDHLSVNVSGIGFDGHVASLFGKNGKRGLVGYGKLVMQEFQKFKEFPLEMELDGQKIVRKSFILALANSSQFGNNARISPFASVCDQLIDVCFIKKVPLIQVLWFARKMFRGKMHRSAFVEIRRGKRLKIEFQKPMPYHIDGEAMKPVAHFDVVLSPASLRIIIPQNLKRTP